MIDDRPELQGQPPAQPKLVLPGFQEDTYYPGAHTQRVYVHPDQMQPKAPSRPGNPLARLGYLWHRDPAYKVLMVATAMVLLAGIIFATFIVSMFAQAAPASQTNTAAQQTPAPAKPTSGTDLQPTFPTPAGAQGGTKSNQPTNTGTPVVLPTLTPAPSPTPVPQPTQPPQGDVIPQIVDIPQQVHSNTVVPVTISVGQPGVEVRLQVTYDQALTMNMSGPKMTDDAGNVTLNWHVNVFAFKQRLVARVTAFAIDQNGQQIQSQTVSVEVTNRLQFG
jgi:hypothetical protein